MFATLFANRSVSSFCVGCGFWIIQVPLSEVSEIHAHVVSIALGGQIGYSTGESQHLFDDLVALKPTVLRGVAFFYNRLYGTLQAELRRTLSFPRKLLNVKRRRSSGVDERNSALQVLDRRMLARLGKKRFPEVCFCVSTGDPLSTDARSFLAAVLDCPVFCRSVATEVSGGAFFSSGEGLRPLPGVEAKLAMSDAVLQCRQAALRCQSSGALYGCGEVYIRGPGIDPKAISSRGEQTEDDAGYFRTGVIGTWSSDGTMIVHGRTRDMFTCSDGKHISPSKLELELARAPLVSQIFVYGKTEEAGLVAVVVPDEEESFAWAAKQGIRPGVAGIRAIGSRPAFKEAILEQLKSAARGACTLGTGEHVQDVLLETDDVTEEGGFRIDNGLLSPMFELNRDRLKWRYEPALRRLYDAGRSSSERIVVRR